ncbi:hypothetical protein ACFWB0_06210 [Rhodococcus sp. NPDC060086]|uniref:hypothetical protein n=1 Tax=Rhodococcus sp. NPDC060086 TaxID=3347055 RepID=UPI0036542354
MAQWFEGLDGQVVLDDDYVWILREGVCAELTHDVAMPPVRALRGAVTGTDFRRATIIDLGMMRIRVSESPDAGRPVSGSDTVRFSLISNDRFSTLDLLLAVSAEDATEPVTNGDQLCSALDGFGGIATQAELADVLGESPDVMHPVEGVMWNSVGSLWVAAGGTVDVDTERLLQRILALKDLLRRLPANSGIKTLQAAVEMTPLNHLGAQRIGGLWEAVMSEALPGRVDSVPVQPRQAPARATPVRRTPSPNRTARPRTRVWTKWDDADSRVLPVDEAAHISEPESSSQVRAELPDTTTAPASEVHPARRRSAFSGGKIRIYLDCDGHRVKAVFDPETGETEITVAPVRALLGSVHSDPDAAAEAVTTVFRLGDDGPFDGWQLWKVDDSSGRSLAETT